MAIFICNNNIKNKNKPIFFKFDLNAWVLLRMLIEVTNMLIPVKPLGLIKRVQHTIRQINVQHSISIIYRWTPITSIYLIYN